MKIYLVGGCVNSKSDCDWREVVGAEIERMRPDAEVYLFGLNPNKEVDADIVFGYIHKDTKNYPSIAFRLGHAHAGGAKIILIDQQDPKGAALLHQFADVYGDIASALAAMPFMEEFLK